MCVYFVLRNVRFFFWDLWVEDVVVIACHFLLLFRLVTEYLVLRYFVWLHVVIRDLISYFLVFTDDVDFHVVFECVRNHVVTRIQSDNRLPTYVKFDSEKNPTELVVHSRSYFSECLAFELYIVRDVLLLLLKNICVCTLQERSVL